jgi:hypothetical protein
MKIKPQLINAVLIGALAASPVFARKFRTDIPSAITIPDSVETRLGTLKFEDGFPDDATVQKVYDNLDFQRGVQAFLTAMPAASLSAMREGLRSIGVNNSTVALFETLMDSKSLFLMANTESVYLVGWLDLKEGPMVIESAPIAPDARMKKILSEAADVANATTRMLMYRSREQERFLYHGSAWIKPAPTYTFEREGVRLLDTRSAQFFYGTGITPAMVIERVGVGSQYTFVFTDAHKQPLDGGKTYRLRLPPHIPAKDFWSLVIYDNQTRSELQTDQQFPSISSQKAGIAVNSDTSVEVYFGPQAPVGRESNWVQTVPGKGWNIILRLYGPLQPWFDKTWRLDEIEEVK